jgi:hypothetical protein
MRNGGFTAGSRCMIRLRRRPLRPQRISSRVSTSSDSSRVCASPTDWRSDAATPSSSWVPPAGRRTDADGAGGNGDAADGAPAAPPSFRHPPSAAIAGKWQRMRLAVSPARRKQPGRLPKRVFRSWLHTPIVASKRTGHAPRPIFPRHITLCAGHLNDVPTSSSGAVHFKRFGQICGELRRRRRAPCAVRARGLSSSCRAA